MRPSKLTTSLLTALVAAMLAGNAQATLLFSDDFESGLGQWTGTAMGSHNGILVADPYDGGNQVLAFSAQKGWGDIFSLDTFSSSTGYVLSFDYLGSCAASDCGGYVGYSRDFPGDHTWLYGTRTTSGAADVLQDNAGWQSYAFEFFAEGAIRLMLEDFVGIGGDAYFDNISLSAITLQALQPATSVPEPDALILLLIGVLALAARRRFEFRA
jgi:hypothetical protein